MGGKFLSPDIYSKPHAHPNSWGIYHLPISLPIGEAPSSIR